MRNSCVIFLCNQILYVEIIVFSLHYLFCKMT